MIRTNDLDFTAHINVVATELCRSCKKGTLVTNDIPLGMSIEFICDTCFSVYKIGLIKISDKKINKEALKAFKKKLKDKQL